MSRTITLSKTEYERLRQIAARFEAMRKLFELDFFAEPPTRDARKILKELHKTGLYNQSFLKSLKQGLGESSYFASSKR